MTTITATAAAPVPATATHSAVNANYATGSWASSSMSSSRLTANHNLKVKMTPAQETLFLNMQLRKMDRALTGTVKRDKSTELWAVFILLVIIYGASSYFTSSWDQTVISLTLGECIAIGSWFFAVVIVTSIFSSSKFIELLYWVCVYLPLLAVAARLLLTDAIDQVVRTDEEFLSKLVLTLLIVAEVVTLLTFFGIYHAYPKILNSNWVRNHPGRVQWLWDVRVVGRQQDWTFNYRRRKAWLFPQRYVCKYEGQLSLETGLPNQLGKWIDDSQRDGEVLTGWWADGVPIAPFSSRQYRTGDMMKCVRLAYVSGSDDEFNTTQLWPSNALKGIRCGVAMVECCVSGKFYNNLPHAQNLTGYKPYDSKSSMGQLITELAPTSSIDEDEDGDREGLGGPMMITTSTTDGTSTVGQVAGQGGQQDVIQIRSSPVHGGVAVSGHVHVPSGKSFESSVTQIVVRVERIDTTNKKTVKNKKVNDTVSVRSSGFMPRSSSSRRASGFFDETIRNVDVGDQLSAPQPQTEGTRRQITTTASVVKEEENEGKEANKISYNEDKQSEPPELYVDDTDVVMVNSRESTSLQDGTVSTPARYHLVVQDWLPTKHREVLVFIPGFNCSLESACQSFGQLLSMTKLDERKIHPLLYSWPCGQVLSYFQASKQTQNDKNHENFTAFLQGLRHAGVTAVHLMSHSMGVQTLIGSLCDRPDGSRSAASKCFQLATSSVASGKYYCDDADTKPESARRDADEDEECGDIESEPPFLICKTLTMLNPDFPLDSFVDHAFASARRICDTMTIVGDKTDQALFFSQTSNGVAIKLFGFEQPCELQPTERNKQRLCQRAVIGRSIDELYFQVRNNGGESTARYEKSQDIPRRLLFSGNSASYMQLEGTTDSDVRPWLDVDVIDCTGLDTNIAGIRHSAYNLNPILLKDLTELIMTGQRAMNRSSTLYRDGNIFSFASAPSYVAY